MSIMGQLASMRDYVPAPNAWRDLEREAIAEQYGGTNIHGMALPPPSKGEPRAWVDAVVPQEPWEWGLAAAGPVGRVAGKVGKAIAAATGMMGSLVDPAEAGLLTKARTLLRGKPGGPHEGGIAAYHSSPHDFDKFDLAKIGTGEGAQVYGHGLYFAENPAVSGQGGTYWSQFLHRFPKDEKEAAEALRSSGFDRADAIANAKGQIEHFRQKIKGVGSASAEDIGLKLPTAEDQRVYRDNLTVYYNNLIKGHQATLDRLSGASPIGPRTYEVNIKARPEELLDWDKKLSEQSQIQERLLPLLRQSDNPHVRAYANTWEQLPHHYTGENVYSAIASQGAPRMDPLNIVGIDKPLASQTLREAGIPGIRYLDEGSRNIPTVGRGRVQAAGPGKYNVVDDFGIQGGPFATLEEARAALNVPKQTYNYVVTDPSKLEIMAKYGIVAGAPIGMGAVAAQDKYR